jgi:hypothetical protein
MTAPDVTESPLQQDPLYFLLLPHQVSTRVAGVENVSVEGGLVHGTI